MSTESELKIRVSTTSDLTGATDAAQAINQVGNALKQTQNAAKDSEHENKGLLESFGSLGHRGNEAREAVEGVARASQGGAGAIFGIAQAVRALLGVIRGGVAASGPIGLFVTILGTLGGLLLVIREKFSKTGEAAEKTAAGIGETNKALDTTKENAGAAEKKLKDLADKGLADATTKAKEMETAFDKAAAAIERTAAAAAKVRAAENERKQAQIEADQASGKLTSEQADAAKFNLNRDAARGDVAAQQKLAADTAKNEARRVEAAQRNVDHEATFGKAFGQTQNDLLTRKSEISGELQNLKLTAERINDEFDEKVTALERQKQPLRLTDDPIAAGKKSLDNSILDGLIEGINETRQATIKSYAEKVTPLATEAQELDKRLAGVNEQLTESGAALQAFQAALKETKTKAAEKIDLVKNDAAVATKVGAIQEGTADLRQITKTNSAFKEKSQAADAAAAKADALDAKIKQAKDDAFLKPGFGNTADTSALEKQRDEARTEEANARRAADALAAHRPKTPPTVDDILKQTQAQELAKKQSDLAGGDPQLEKNTKAAADEVAATREQIKKRESDPFLKVAGGTADTTQLEHKLSSRQAALDEAQKAQESDLHARAEQSRAISEASNQPKISHRGITDSHGNPLPIDNLTKPGEGKAVRTPEKGTAAVIDSNDELVAALRENTAALRAAAGSSGGAPKGDGGKAGDKAAAETKKAAGDSAQAFDKYHATVKGTFVAQKEKHEAHTRDIDQIRRELDAMRDAR